MVPFSPLRRVLSVHISVLLVGCFCLAIIASAILVVDRSKKLIETSTNEMRLEAELSLSLRAFSEEFHRVTTSLLLYVHIPNDHNLKVFESEINSLDTSIYMLTNLMRDRMPEPTMRDFVTIYGGYPLIREKWLTVVELVKAKAPTKTITAKLEETTAFLNEIKFVTTASVINDKQHLALKQKEAAIQRHLSGHSAAFTLVFAFAFIFLIATIYMMRQKAVESVISVLLNRVAAFEDANVSTHGESRSVHRLANRIENVLKKQVALNAELVGQRDFLEVLIANLPLSLYCKDAEDDFKIVIWNAGSEKIFGLRAEQMLTKTDYDIFLRDDSDRFRQADIETMRKGKAVVIAEEVVSTVNRGDRILHTTKVPIYNEDGSDKYLIGFSLDITERKKLEAQLQDKNAQMIKTAKLSAIGEMTAEIAHEVNSPLSVIVGNAQLVKRSIEQNDLSPQRVKQILHMTELIEATAKRISKIIKGLRNASRDDSGDSCEMKPLKALVEETLAFCEGRFRQHEIRLEVDSISEDLEIECRPIQISQVILNLLNNAFDAVKDSSGAWVKIQVRDCGSDSEISITDSGYGIPVELRPKLMQAFFTTKSSGAGTGLGLSIGKGIMSNHGGELFLDESCKNTRFVIRLPKLQAIKVSAAA